MEIALTAWFMVLVLRSLQNSALGAPEYRIVGGGDALPGKYAFAASLQIDGWHTCGATILSKKTVLTAAHCLGEYIRRYSVYVGSISTISGGIRYQAEDRILNPKYATGLFKHDTAVVFVEGEIEFTPDVQPIEMDTDYIEGDQELVVTGWGMTSHPKRSEILQVLILKSLSHGQCQDKFDAINFALDRSILCTFTRHGEGICFGDSGSGLIRDRKLVGVAAWLIPCAVGWPDGFGRITADYEWIVSVMK